jgi:hypothetical protein
MRKLLVILAITAALTNFTALTAHATGLIPVGSTVTFSLTDFPGASSTISTTFGGGATVSGNLEIFDFAVGTPGGGEWDYFQLTTTDGSLIGATASGYWSIHMNYVLSQPVYFDGVERQWLDGTTPTPANPSTNWGVGNPVFGPIGNGYGNGYGTTGSPFSALIAGGPETNWLEVYVTPYSYAASNGVDPAATGYYFAYHFDPVPVPASLFLLGPGLLGLVGMRRRLKK